MFGPKLNTVFASRWKALLWSAGVLATAYCSIPDSELTPEGGPTAVSRPDHGGPHKSPWAK